MTGNAMTALFWPLAINTWGDAERAAAHRVIDSGDLTMGAEVAAFEREFAAYVGSRHAVMVNSGSSANLLAVAVAHQSFCWPMDYTYNAVVPAIAWATTYAPLHQHGLALRVADVHHATLNMVEPAARGLVDSRTRMIVGVSILGNPAPVDALRRLADERGLFFLEDNCESLGARISSRHCGTFGHIGTFSTFFSHHLNTGEGGMLVTDDDQLYELAVCMRAHGWTRSLAPESTLRVLPEMPGGYQFVLPGYNLRPTELAAAVGRVQLRRLDEMNAVRLKNWERFHECFSGDPRWRLQCRHSPEMHAVPFGFTLVFEDSTELRWAKTKLHHAGIEHRMITGGSFSEHPAEAHYHWEALADLTAARHIHYSGLFVGNQPINLTEQIERMAEVLR